MKKKLLSVLSVSYTHLPELAEQYRLDSKEFVFGIRLIPYKN